MTLIIGAKCKDGVVVVADRRVTNSDRLVEKIRKPKNMNNVIFTAGGYETVFKDYLDDLSGKAEYWYNWTQEENKKNPPSLHHDFTHREFKKCCIETLTELKKTYRALGENESYEQILQVLFAVPEFNDEEAYTQLYWMDMGDCAPQAVELGSIAVIGYKQLALPFIQSIMKNKDVTMVDVARVASFTIKFIEKENLAEGAVGVGDLDPQIYFIPDGKPPSEPTPEQLTVLMKDVNTEVEKLSKMLGESSNFLRF